MTDDQQAHLNPEAHQDAPMPSAEQGATEAETPEVASSQEESTQKDDLSLPEGTKERTSEQFEKLKTQLAEERQKRTQLESVFTQIRQQQAAQAPQMEKYIDEMGYFDKGRFEQDKRLAEIEQRAYNAEQAVRQAQLERDHLEEREAFEAHPELDPNRESGFNEDLYDLVIQRKAFHLAKGENVSFKKAADEVKSVIQGNLRKAENKGATEALESLSPKEQAALEATGRSDRRGDGVQQDLVMRTRKNDWDAISERLNKIPPVGR